MTSSDTTEPPHLVDPVETVARLARERGLRVAVAESLTSGAIASRLGAGPAASEWYRGGVVAYDAEVKFEVLGVRPGPVVAEDCALQMARGVGRLLGADVTLAVTGVGGPEPDEGHPAGTAYVAARVGDTEHCVHHVFPGEPPEVIEAATDAAVTLLADHLVGGSVENHRPHSTGAAP